MKQRHPAILTAIPVAFPELVRVRVQVLNEERECVVQERDWTPLLPWSRIERLPMPPGTREESDQLLREGRNAFLGVHLIEIDLNESFNAALEFAWQ